MQRKKIKSIPNRLEFFPVMMFAIVMGLSGLSLTLSKAHEVFGLAAILAQTMSFITIVVFILILLTYAIKIVKYPAQVKAELSHTIRINFFLLLFLSHLFYIND